MSDVERSMFDVHFSR